MTPVEKQLILTTLIAALPGLLAGLIALWVAVKKNPHDIENIDAETKKKKAETESIHQQVADRWAEHVNELTDTVHRLEKCRDEDRKMINNLQLDLNQVRRENESYRIELRQRDEIIESLKDWADRLTKQVITHAPHIIPEKYYRRRTDA